MDATREIRHSGSLRQRRVTRLSNGEACEQLAENFMELVLVVDNDLLSSLVGFLKLPGSRRSACKEALPRPSGFKVTTAASLLQRRLERLRETRANSSATGHHSLEGR